MTTRTHKSRIRVTAVLIAALFCAAHAAIAQTDSNGPAGSPAIVLPDRLLSGSQGPDAPIDIRFVTAPDTTVDLSSLHVWVHKLIGWVEVTDQLLTHPQVRINRWGIHIDGGVLPVGDHQVRLSFHDMKGRVLDATETIRIILRAGSST
jgi:hypothetical protein